jgi:hypothetical protein
MGRRKIGDLRTEMGGLRHDIRVLAARRRQASAGVSARSGAPWGGGRRVGARRPREHPPDRGKAGMGGMARRSAGWQAVGSAPRSREHAGGAGPPNSMISRGISFEIYVLLEVIQSAPKPVSIRRDGVGLGLLCGRMMPLVVSRSACASAWSNSS